ncbi:MAG: CDP-alcohol phosphatidyltransferase family protein [Muribaculaceae bacterium]|nr:CDP-alcohol phosphatidyltransferase family protein [Muribaculaceae bacterium]MDE5930174.1 CDP-alcohol phosphatidyltransferase family protein [Muribaculaceae bacterium]
MDIKKQSKAARDAIQQGIYCVINPFVRLLIRMGVTPNMVTTIGFLGNVAAAVILVYEGYRRGMSPDYGMVTLAGALIIGFSLFDMLDGQVARLGNMTSSFGAMYDSVLDRYCELFNLGGIAYYLIQTGHLAGALITFLALVGSLMVSYVRARAEGLGIECKVGFMQRPERVVVTAAAILATGIYGMAQKEWESFDPNVILVIAMALIAIFANLTAVARLEHCRKKMM